MWAANFQSTSNHVINIFLKQNYKHFNREKGCGEVETEEKEEDEEENNQNRNRDRGNRKGFRSKIIIFRVDFTSQLNAFDAL